MKGKCGINTFSGSAIETTFNNTMIVTLLNQFILYKANVPIDKYFIYASGDDVMVLIAG